jgi:hypothetical protein
MTTASDPGDRRRSLSDDLLDDLRQGPSRVPAPTASPRPQAGPPADGAAALSAPPTPTVELRITPRSWSPAGVAPLPDGGGVAVSLGPVRVSLWRNRG